MAQAAVLAQLRAEVVQLKATFEELAQRLGHNSHNSSQPPSADPPHALRRSRREPSGRRPDGQPGHEGQPRPLSPVEEVDVVIPVKPVRCPRCEHPLQGEDAQPPRHQVTEIPRVQAITAPCTGAYHLSKRTTQQVMANLFGLPLSVGTIANLEHATVQALAEPVTEARSYVQQQPAAYLDETGWREGHQRAWLWTAVTV